jgi:hypothetical protein
MHFSTELHFGGLFLKFRTRIATAFSISKRVLNSGALVLDTLLGPRLRWDPQMAINNLNVQSMTNALQLCTLMHNIGPSWESTTRTLKTIMMTPPRSRLRRVG